MVEVEAFGRGNQREKLELILLPSRVSRMHDKVKLNFTAQKIELIYRVNVRPESKHGKHVNGDQYVFHVVSVNELLHKVFNWICLRSFYFDATRDSLHLVF
jgi:hypothetical protein